MARYSKKTESLDDTIGIVGDYEGVDDFSGDNIIAKYFKEVQRYPLLTREEEIDLAKKIEKGDEKAKKRFVESNLRLVIHIAKRYKNSGLPLDELIQEGNIGLMTAIDKYDYKRGFKFSTYATWWIRHGVSRAIADKGRTIRNPVHISDSLRKIEETKRELQTNLGREPTITELSKMTSLSVEQIEKALSSKGHVLSLDQTVNDENDTFFGDFLKSDSLSPEESYSEELTKYKKEKSLDRALTSLKPIEADVIRRRFGINGENGNDYGKEQTLEQIGNDYNLTRERIRQIQETALDKIRVGFGLEPTPQNNSLKPGEITFDEFLKSKGYFPKNSYFNREEEQKMEESLEILEPREVDVIKRRFGLGMPREPLTKIGKKYGLAANTINAIQRKALNKIREQFGIPKPPKKRRVDKS